MAVLVALGGAALGSLVGAPNLGFMAGSILGNILFPSGQDTQGPRLSDLSVQSSAWGAPIPWGDGTVRVAGNVIWSPGIQETQNTQSTGGFKGGAFSGPTATTFSYSVSYAVAFAEGPASDCIRIWADKKLIFDKTSTNSNRMPGLKFRFYKGDRTQLPDPLISADPRIGVGMTPAWRGIVYIVFENLPLDNFGNHVPSIEIELAFKSLSSTLYVHSTQLVGGASSTSIASLQVDFNRRLVYVPRGTQATANESLGVYNYDNMVEQRQQLRTNMGAPSGNQFKPYWFYKVAPDGFIYGTGGPDNSSPIICLDPESLVEVGRFGQTSNALVGILSPSDGNSINLPTGFGFASNYDPLTGSRQDYVVASQFGDGQLGVFRAHSVEFVAVLTIPTGAYNSLFGRLAQKGLGDLYACSSAGGILRILITSDAHYELPAGALPEQQFGVTLIDLGAITPPEIDPTATTFASLSFRWAGYDPSDDSLIGTASVADGTGLTYVFKWREGTGVIWSTAINFNIGPPDGRIGDGRYAWQGTSSVALLDTVTGAVSYITVATTLNGTQVYDYVSDSIVLFDTSTPPWTREFLNRGAGQPTNVGDVVKQICGKVDLATGDLDTTALDTIPVAGYIVGRSITAKDAITPLGQAFFFDGAESDSKIKFVLRGANSAFTVPQQNLAIVDDQTGRVVVEKRTADLELPQSCTVTFLDQTKDYQQNSKTRQRPKLPLPTMSADGNIAVTLPIVMGPDDGKQIADKTLYASWLERSAYQMKWAWAYLDTDPTDIGTVDLDDGTAFIFRAQKIGIGVDYAIAIEAVSQDAIAYTSTVTAGSDLHIPQTVKNPGFTELMVLDVPLLRDIDDGGGASSIIYVAASSFNNPDWPGCQIFRSTTSASNGDQVATDVIPATWGSCATALPDNLSPWSWDNTTQLRIYLANQGDRELASSTDIDVYGGANAAVVIRADGYSEVIQFVNVNLETDGSYTLSRLLRGRRGTDVFCGGHAVGDRFILLGDPDFQTLAVPVSDAGLARYWRGVGFGTKVEEAAVVTKTTNALDLRPYMPTEIEAASTVGGSPDIDLTWVRRNRLHANLFALPAGVVPLSETSEAYEVDILSGPLGTLKRTISSLTSPAATYSNANIVTDFGSLPATLTLKVYQMSSIVGRGLSREVTVGVS